MDRSAERTATKAVLTKSQIVLPVRTKGALGVSFGEREADRIIWVNRHVWKDLGYPETITVTIEPGDRLNP